MKQENFLEDFKVDSHKAVLSHILIANNSLTRGYLNLETEAVNRTEEIVGEGEMKFLIQFLLGSHLYILVHS